MKKTGKVIICGCGFKGQRFIEHALKHWNVGAVFTYTQPNVLEDSAAIIQDLCQSQGVPCMDNKRPDFKLSEPFDLCFLVGWQFLLEGMDDRFVVFHDSILPKYRGFAPTVAALIKGDNHIGVTALLPCVDMDAGPVLVQEAIAIVYPITLNAAFEELAHAYNKIADRLVEAVQHGPLRSIAKAQDESKVTYSVWRGREDQRIDWNKSSDAIERLVNAVSWPYTGAYTFCDGQEIIVHEVAVMPEIPFEERHPGKFWSITDNQPLVICGNGILKILRATLPDGSPVTFSRMRVRCV